MQHPADQQIRLRAHQLWQERGEPWGTPETDWFQAEYELGSKKEGAVTGLAREVGAAAGTLVAFLNAIGRNN